MNHGSDNYRTRLKEFTSARVALGRVGYSLPTSEVLALGLAQAEARDAVHAELPVQSLTTEIERLGLGTITVQSAARDRSEYIRRPDLGRRLDGSSSLALARQGQNSDPRLLFMIGDGLSAAACERHAIPLLSALLPRLADWQIGPVVLARQARVALGDEVGETLNASVIAVLIGERPGLSSPDSLGAYITFRPKRGRSDAERNCVSNIRSGGLTYDEAAYRLHHLLESAWRRQLTGVALKDESGPRAPDLQTQQARIESGA